MQMTIVQESYLTAEEQRDLTMHEQRIETALDQMLAAGVIVGVNLREINHKRLYRAYGTFEQYVADRWQKGRQWAYQLIGAAQVLDNIGLTNVSHGVQIPTERQLRPLTALPAEVQPIAWQEAQERSGGKPTARVVEEVVREMRGDALPPEAIAADVAEVLDPPIEPAQAVDLRPRVNAGLFTSATPEWYTPGKIIDRVISVFGEIDLDPCSNSKDRNRANVPALNYWTKEDDGLAQPWLGRVYMNPPYGDEIGGWVERMVSAYQSGEIIEAIALLPARTDTAWFQPLFDYSVCFVRGRLKFSGSENSAPFPSVVVYLGADQDCFKDWFNEVGPIVSRSQ